MTDVSIVTIWQHKLRLFLIGRWVHLFACCFLLLHHLETQQRFGFDVILIKYMNKNDIKTTLFFPKYWNPLQQFQALVLTLLLPSFLFFYFYFFLTLILPDGILWDQVKLSFKVNLAKRSAVSVGQQQYNSPMWKVVFVCDFRTRSPSSDQFKSLQRNQLIIYSSSLDAAFSNEAAVSTGLSSWRLLLPAATLLLWRWRCVAFLLVQSALKWLH